MWVRPAWIPVCCWLLTAACDCDHENGNPILFSGGSSRSGRYESSPVVGPWLEFPGGRRFVLEHRLAAAPTRILTYLAFREYPLDATADGSSNFTPAAGDSTLIERLDQEYITVRNSTCSNYYLRVVAEADLADGGVD